MPSEDGGVVKREKEKEREVWVQHSRAFYADKSYKYEQRGGKEGEGEDRGMVD